MSNPSEDLRHPQPNYEIQNAPINQIYKDVILRTGKTSISHDKGFAGEGKPDVCSSVWIVPHSSFSSRCDGIVYIVSASETGVDFESIGDNCTGCDQPPVLKVSISRSELENKNIEDKLRDEAIRKLALIKGETKKTLSDPTA